MSDKTLIIDEPVATGWLRSEFHGDTEKAKGYALAARKVLGGMRSMYGVNDRIANGEGGGFYKQAVNLPDGTRIEALTNDGHDTIRIYASSSFASFSDQFTPDLPSTAFEGVPTSYAFTQEFPAEARPERKFREYCAWGPDREVYSAPISVASTSGLVMDTKGRHVYLGVTHWQNHPQQVMIFDGNTLDQVGAIAIDLPKSIFDDQGQQWGRRMAVDINSDTFIWIVDGFITGSIYANYGYIWQAGDDAVRTVIDLGNRFNDENFRSLELKSESAVAGKLVVGGTANYFTGGVMRYVTYILDFAAMDILYSESFADPGHTQGEFSPYAAVMPNGDVILQYISGSVFPNNFNVVSFGQSDIVYDPSNAPGQAWSENYTLVGTNDGQLWLLMLSDGFNRISANSWSLYRTTNRGWESVEVEGGIYFASKTSNSADPALLHDPVSDAVALVQCDASGAWIFNATDCLGNPIHEFFFPFETPPAALSWEALGSAQMFYDGTLLLLFGASTDGFIVGRYDIGILSQTKLEEEVFS